MNKQEIQGHFKSGDVPTEAQFAEWIERCVVWVDALSELPPAGSGTAGSCYLVGGCAIYRCVNTEDGWKWQAMSTSGGATSYLELSNKPRIGGTTLSGNMTPDGLGIMPDFAGMSSVPGKLQDDLVAVVGIRTTDNKTVPVRTTLGALRAYFAGNGSYRTRIAFSGAQNGTNTYFPTEFRFVAGTSALYSNGLRLTAGTDYTETEGMGFKTTVPPTASDKLLFEAVKISSTQQTSQ